MNKFPAATWKVIDQTSESLLSCMGDLCVPGDPSFLMFCDMLREVGHGVAAEAMTHLVSRIADFAWSPRESRTRARFQDIVFEVASLKTSKTKKPRFGTVNKLHGLIRFSMGTRKFVKAMKDAIGDELTFSLGHTLRVRAAREASRHLDKFTQACRLMFSASETHSGIADSWQLIMPVLSSMRQRYERVTVAGMSDLTQNTKWIHRMITNHMLYRHWPGVIPADLAGLTAIIDFMEYGPR